MFGWLKKKREQREMGEAAARAYREMIARYVKPSPELTEAELKALPTEVARNTVMKAIEVDYIVVEATPSTQSFAMVGPHLQELYARYESIGTFLRREDVGRDTPLVYAHLPTKVSSRDEERGEGSLPSRGNLTSLPGR